MPDFFHCMHDLVQSYSFSIAWRVSQAQQGLKQAEEVLRRHSTPEGQHHVEVQRADVQRWEGVHSTYRHHLEVLSRTLHPLHIDDSTPQTSAQVQNRFQAAVAIIATFAQDYQVPARHDAMKKVHKPLPALAALGDFWWAGVGQDLEQAAVSLPWRTWVRESLLPWVYWEHHMAHTRCPRRKAQMRRAWEAMRTAFHQHELTLRLPAQALDAWHTWATQQVRALQRTSSAVEGRNGALAQLHHNQRGVPKQRYKVWTILHNFDCRAPDGTTPAARFFQSGFPDLFETVLSHIDELSQPRQRKHAVARSH